MRTMQKKTHGYKGGILYVSDAIGAAKTGTRREVNPQTNKQRSTGRGERNPGNNRTK